MYSILKDHNADIAWANIYYVNEKHEIVVTEHNCKRVAHSLSEKLALAKHGYIWNKLYRTDIDQ